MAFLMFKELVVKQPFFTFFFYLNLIKIVSIERLVHINKLHSNPIRWHESSAEIFQCSAVQCREQPSYGLSSVQCRPKCSPSHWLAEKIQNGPFSNVIVQELNFIYCFKDIVKSRSILLNIIWSSCKISNLD